MECPRRLMPLVLASASPRRRDILEAAGWQHTVSPSDVDESARAGESALACCERLARDKARAVGSALCTGGATQRPGGVLAGDTIVEIDGEMLGKPVDRREASAMLRRLSGRIHRVASAVALLELASGELASGVAVSEVRFDELDEAVLATYLDSHEWAGKAGGYAIQGAAGAFAQLVTGSVDTVIGLPMELVRQLGATFASPVDGSASEGTAGRQEERRP